MTGADSPVMALSSTEATPSMMSPSAGMTSPADTRTISPLRSCGAATFSSEAPGVSRLAIVSVLALRSVSACALPRPSAIASAKLAKSTVSQSQNVIWNSKPRPGRPASASWISRSVVSTLPISTTNITGLRAIVRGWSFFSESWIARCTILGSQMEIDLAFDCVVIRTPVRASS